MNPGDPASSEPLSVSSSAAPTSPAEIASAADAPRYGLPPTPEFLAMMEQRRLDLQNALDKIFTENQPAPSSLSSAASSPRPFVWELGAGHGHFLTAYAQAHPEKLCIGVDISSERVGRATRKRDRAGLANLHFLHGEATLFLKAMRSGLAFSELFILFPDPWPKSRHHKNRIIQPAFLADAASRATPDCRLYFRTDHAPYFVDAHATVAAHPDWELITDREPWPFEYETVFQQRAPSHQSLIARRRVR